MDKFKKFFYVSFISTHLLSVSAKQTDLDEQTAVNEQTSPIEELSQQIDLDHSVIGKQSVAEDPNRINSVVGELNPDLDILRVIKKKNSSKKEIRKALDKIGNPNVQDKDGRTIFSHAVESDNSKALDVLLIERGANPLKKDSQGKSPLEYTEKETPVHKLLNFFKKIKDIVSKFKNKSKGIENEKLAKLKGKAVKKIDFLVKEMKNKAEQIGGKKGKFIQKAINVIMKKVEKKIGI